MKRNNSEFPPIHDFSVQLKKIVSRYKKIGYNKDILRQTACIVVNPIMVNKFAPPPPAPSLFARR